PSSRRRRMGAAIGEILPLAIGVALSPLPIMAVIVMLIATQKQRNAVAFVTGWALGAFLECALVTFLAVGATLQTSAAHRTRLAAIAQVLIGVITLALAVTQWRTRPAPGAVPKLPRWMQALNRLNAATSLGFGALYVGANVKNVPLIISA